MRVAATLRVPTTYRNPGVPDEPRALGATRHRARRLGQERRAGRGRRAGARRDEWASAFRAWVRSVLVATVAPLERRGRRRRRRDRDRRSHGAGAGRRGAAAGGRHVSRDRDLRRQHRDSDRAAPRRRALAGRVAANRRGRRDRRAAVLRPGHRAGAVGRPRHLGGGHLSGRTAPRLRGPSINILAVAATLGLSSSPMAVFDPGFLLSFGATLGILIGVPRLALGRPRRRSARAACSRVARSRSRRVRSPAALHGSAGDRLPPRSCWRRWRGAVRPRHVRWPAPEPRRDSADDRRPGGLARGAGAWLLRSRLARACGYVVHVAARGLVDSARLVDVAPWLSRDSRRRPGVCWPRTTARSSCRCCRRACPAPPRS